MEEHYNYNKNYVHHQKFKLAPVLKEVVFGIEDGMVSTLGSITGIAIGSSDQPTVILAGIVIIAVESISMGIGSYLSNKSEKDMDLRKIFEEKEEIKKFPEKEEKELYQIYLKDGWPEDVASNMVEVASKDKDLMLREMMLRELKIVDNEGFNSFKGGVYMFFAYILGGVIPLISYFVLPIKNAMPISICITLVGLFVLGMSTTRFTKESLLKSGARMFLLGGIALVVGLLAGSLIGQ